MLVLYSFLWMNNILLNEYTTFCLSIVQLIDIWVASIFLAIMNNAAINIYVQILCEHIFKFPLSIYIEVKLLGHNTNCMFDFLRKRLLSSVTAPLYIPIRCA